LKEWSDFKSKVSSNPNVTRASQDIENQFKASQIAYQNKATVFPRGKPELQQNVKTGFTAALTEQSLVSPGDARGIIELMNDKSEKQANDQYMAWSERGQGGQKTWWVGIMRDGKLEKAQVKQSAFQQNTLLQKAIPNEEFQDRFELRLGARGGRDTYRDDKDREINGGQVSAYQIPMQSGTIKYTDNGQIVEGIPAVQYHLEEPANAPGRYAIKLFITDAKTGKVLVPGALYPPVDMYTPGETPALTQEQVISTIKRTLANPTSIQGYLDKYYNKK
jgi:hypothetical protein